MITKLQSIGIVGLVLRKRLDGKHGSPWEGKTEYFFMVGDGSRRMEYEDVVGSRRNGLGEGLKHKTARSEMHLRGKMET